MPTMAAAEPAVRAPDPAPPVELRTPGSSYILPANPLYDVSDESLEGFVDCTIYEESGNFFHPAFDGGDANDEAADPPAARPARATASIPAMPFDTAPNLTVQSRGNTESLAVAPEAPRPETEPPGAQDFGLTSTAALFAPLHDGRAQSATPWLDAVSATYSNTFAPDAPPPEPGSVSGELAHQRLLTYPTVDATRFSHHTAPPQTAQLAGLPAVLPVALPEPEPIHILPAWQRVLLISGTAAVAVVLAFLVARFARGSAREAPAAVATAVVAPRPTPPPTPPPHLRPGANQGQGMTSPKASSGSDASHAVEPDRQAVAAPAPASSAAPAASAEPAGSADSAADSGPPDDEGEAASGGAPIVGSGPCRFTVATTPAGSLVRLDDQPMGPSPLTIDGTCDKHKLEVSHARYQTLTKWVTLVADKPQEVDISLSRPIHAVTVTSLPAGAELSIEGHRAGTTPTVVQMTGFATVHLTFTKPGFKSVTKRVYSKFPQDRVFVKLIK